MSSEVKRRRHTRSKFAGLIFPIGRIENAIRKLQSTNKIKLDVGPYITGMIEELAKQLLSASYQETKRSKRVRITSKDVRKALEEHPDLASVQWM